MNREIIVITDPEEGIKERAYYRGHTRDGKILYRLVKDDDADKKRMRRRSRPGVPGNRYERPTLSRTSAQYVKFVA